MQKPMQDCVYLTHDEVYAVAKDLASRLPDKARLYPVPRGGVPVAYLLKSFRPDCIIMDYPENANVIVDDIIDSGTTRKLYPNQTFFALYAKPFTPSFKNYLMLCSGTSFGRGLLNEWVVFPWEGTEEKSAEDIVTRLLQFIGEDPSREGLEETPKRFLKAWKFWTKGYREDPAEIMKVFEDGGEAYDEMVIVKDIPFYSFCEHHLAAIIGTASIAYIPDGKILGLSKMPRVVEIFARRLQVQERLTAQIADCLMEHLAPKGVGVFMRARHLCMESRGVEKPGAETVTIAVRGGFKTNPETRAEFMSMVSK